MMNFEADFAKWIEKIAAVLRKKYNRDYKSLPYAFELRYFSGYSTAEVIHEIELLFPDIHVKKPGNVLDKALRY